MQSRKFLRVASPIIIVSLLLSTVAPVLLTGKSATVSGEGDEKVYYFLNDHLGSVDVVLDEVGNVVERRDYLPYGAERAQETFNGVPITDLGFTGKELDDETGLNYYGARYYDPVSGRFIQMDPLLLNLDHMSLAQRNAFLSNPQNLNTYAYVQNNPVNYTDPTGMYGEDVHYDLTYYLCLQAGLTQDQSKIIAFRDNNTDHNWETRPENPKATLGYHFAERSDARERVADSIKTKSSPELGEALHTFQDTYSHGGITPAEHLKLDLYANPDRTYADVPKAMEMAKETFFYLRKHNLKTQGSGDMTAAEYRKEGVRIWNTIEGNVENYLGLEDKTETSIAIDAKTIKKD